MKRTDSRPRPAQCQDCGKFIGKDDFFDASLNYEYGGYDLNYAYCKRCGEARGMNKKEPANAAT